MAQLSLPSLPTKFMGLTSEVTAECLLVEARVCPVWTERIHSSSLPKEDPRHGCMEKRKHAMLKMTFCSGMPSPKGPQFEPLKHPKISVLRSCNQK